MPEVNCKIPLASFVSDVSHCVSSHLCPISSSFVVSSNAGNGVASVCGMFGASRHKEGPGPGIVSRPVATPPLGMEISGPFGGGSEFRLPDNDL